MNSLADRRGTFDQVAEQYDRCRPGYPEPLVGDIVRLSEIPPGGRILEIGCGTGQATARFAQRGFRMTCLELGPRLAAVAARKLAGFPNVRIEVCAFEDWSVAESDFDLAIAAQSFHFIEPVAGLARIGRTLRSGGAIAIFSNQPQCGDAELDRRIQEAYARHAPALALDDPEDPLEEHIDESGLFEAVIMKRYPWRIQYGVADYLSLLETTSPHRLLPPDQRAALHQAIGSAITEAGGSIAIDYLARLHLARRKART